jgi:hypothetical protein
MTGLRQAIRRLLRGAQTTRFLAWLGIDARRYWILIDLFGELSDRGEVLDQLGTQGVALKGAMWLYGAYSALLSILLLLIQPSIATFYSLFLWFTAFVLFSILLSEAGNSLVNPAESLVLAHQPIDGATYTAAKLSHLGRIILYLVPGLNLVPAFAGLLMPGCRWFDPALHLAAALVVGFLAGFLCCALYGWLMRLLPVRRLRAAGQFAGALPFFFFMASQPLTRLFKHLKIPHLPPVPPAVRIALAAAFGCCAIAVVFLGIRSLSADYLIRVTQMMHGGSPAPSGARKSRIGDLVAKFSGGQPGRAGYLFVSCMARRDFQFLRQVAFSAVGVTLGFVPIIGRDWRTDPFLHRFTSVHLLPHVLGAALFFVCAFLPYGADFKGAWWFLLVPAGAFRRFARGIHAALWIHLVAIPHSLALLIFAWPWGWRHAGLFVAYSMAVASFYLALELRLIEAVPFSLQINPKRTVAELPLFLLAAVLISVAVGLQYFLLFRNAATVAAAAAMVGAAAWHLTRGSLEGFAESMRYSLGLVSGESATLFREIDS